jgi:uncharacterized membrane protein
MAPPDTSDPRPGRWPVNDDAIELLVARLLRAGVVAAAAIVLVGGVVYLRMHAHEPPPGAVFVGEPDEFTHIGGILRAAAALRGRGLVMCGLLLLVATPVVRVALSLVAFALQRDRLYAGITAFVLVLLLASLAGVVI